MGPLPGNWLAACIADLTTYLQVLLSVGSTVVSFHSRQSVSSMLPWASLPPACNQSVYHMLFWLHHQNAPHAQTSEASLKIRLRFSSSSFVSSLLDLTVATSSGLILKIWKKFYNFGPGPRLAYSLAIAIHKSFFYQKLMYSNCSKISNTFLFLFSNKMLVFRAGIHIMLLRIANREDPDQTALSEAVWSGSALFVYAFFGRQLVFEILEHLP